MRPLLVPLALACLAAPAAADRTRDLERRVEQLERELAELKTKVGGQPPSPRPGARHRLDRDRRYRVQLDDSPALGPAHAPITIVAAVQFPEPYTHRAWPTLMQLLAENKDLRIVIKSFVVHPQHVRSSIAMCALAYQTRDPARAEAAIWDTALQPDPVTGDTTTRRSLSDHELHDIAASLGLDLRRYNRDLATCEAAKSRDAAALGALGQVAVPVFWINGRPLEGAQPIESFRAMIVEEREAWRKAKAAGVRPERYYAKLIDGAAP